MRNFLFITIALLSYSCNLASDLTIVTNKQTIYGIVIPSNPSKQEEQAASILSHYIRNSTGVTLGVYSETMIGDKPGIYIGKTKKLKSFEFSSIKGEGYIHHSNTKDFFIIGGSGKGLTYGTYAFIEKFLEGKKYADEKGKVKELRLFEIPSNYHYEYTSPFIYREVYYPMSNDVEYLQWHGLHKFEDLWGIWGHSYFKLVNPSVYWKSNPEYFALDNGKRKPTQICPSNPHVLKIISDELRKRINQNPDAEYWSISAEDDIGYCTCDNCAKIIKEEGGPTGPHIRLVNAIAKIFPSKKFTTLAYTYTLRAPFKTKPAPNVYVMLSTIDAYRNLPIETEPTAAAFRNALQQWNKLTENIFVWDYTTQFTNYLAPLTDIKNLVANIRYFGAHGVKGIFSQGSGDTYGELAELKSYIIAKTMWNPGLDEKELLADFYKGYYKGAGQYVEQYVNQLQNLSLQSNRFVDIYGNPVNEYNSYLTPENLDNLSTLLDNAEGAAEENELLLDKVYRIRICMDYVVLQQARLYGTEKFGYLIKDENNPKQYIVNPKIKDRVVKFVKAAKNLGVKELSEGGFNPDKYAEEWEGIYKRGWTKNIAKDATVRLATEFAPEYPAKKEKTLTDEIYGEMDYSYNWLCFYGKDLNATIELKENNPVNKISISFLDDPRHWIFLPNQVEVQVSADGKDYTLLKTNSTINFNSINKDEHYQAATYSLVFTPTLKTIKFIKVVAKNIQALPEWRYKPNRKPMVACDEILVE